MQVVGLAFTALLAMPALGQFPAGAWRMTVDDNGAVTALLLRLERKESGWAGTVLGSVGPLGANTKPMTGVIEGARLDGERLRFTLKLDGVPLTFDGRAPPGQPIAGSLANGDAILLTVLEPSSLTAFDATALLQEIVLHAPPGPPLYQAAIALLSQATTNKSKPDDVRRWAAKAIAAAEPNGVRWQILVTLRLVQALLRQPEFYAVALEMIQQADRLLEPNDDLALQCEVVEALQTILEQGKKSDEARKAADRLAGLDERGNREDLARATFRPPARPNGRSAGRACLLELFTGADCPPCVAADLATDAVRAVYPSDEVVVLQYHINIPWPDPLANPAGDARQAYYKIDGTPATYFNGKAGAGGGGSADDVEKKFQAYQKALEPALAGPPGVKLRVSAQQSGDRIVARIQVRDLAQPGLTRRLHVMLVESFVRYRGSNGMPFHRGVVRGEFGPPEGTVLANASSDHEYAVDLASLRSSLGDYLSAVEKANPDRPFARRPLGLRHVRVAAFVQDDTTREVLNAVMVDVK